MMYDIEKIFKNFSSEDIQDRLNCIWDTMSALEELQNEIQKQGYWCPTCQRWYYKKDCHVKKEEKTRTVCTNPLMGYLDDYEYEEDKYVEFYYICPENHEVRHSRIRGFTL